jgi:xanthine dehydrogenase accessory factor
MRELLAHLSRWQREDEQIAMATLVRVQGSAPQPPGARMCSTRSGKLVGSVSGGCVESDVFERALQVLDSGKAVLAPYGIADNLGLEVGLTCGGVIDVLIEPFVPVETWHALLEALENQRPAALAIGLTPPLLLGRRLAVVDDETAVGSIDPSLDRHVIASAHHLLANGGTCLLARPWQGGEATIFIEGFPAPRRLFIIGATHTAVALCRLAKAVGFHITVVDPRTLYATAERFPDADQIVHSWPAEALAAATLDGNACVAVLAHDPRLDLPALAQALRSKAGYIGVMGSRRTHERRIAQLRQEGFCDDDVLRLYAPIGLDIGARAPEEIALAILAEMLAVRYGKGATALGSRRAIIDAER